MTGLVHRTGGSIALWRAVIEVSVVLIGMLLGGPVGQWGSRPGYLATITGSVDQGKLIHLSVTFHI